MVIVRKRRNDSRHKSPIVKQEACYAHGKRVEVKKISKILFPIAYGESRTKSEEDAGR